MLNSESSDLCESGHKERNESDSRYRQLAEKKEAFISNFFSTRVIVEWNRLPNEVKEAGTAKNFKRLYRRHCVGTVTPA